MLPAHLQGVKRGFYLSNSSSRQILQIGASESVLFSSTLVKTCTIDFFLTFLLGENNEFPGISVFLLVSYKIEFSGRTWLLKESAWVRFAQTELP